jgi:Nucleotidyltransferase/DNA polymerase involved in DNA repair
VSGLQKLVGSPRQISQKILKQLEENHVSGNVAVANTAETAVLLSRHNKGLSHTASSQDELRQLPLQNLQIEPDTLNVFNALGINRVEELQKIPADELIARYGQDFKNVLDVIEQNGKRFVTPNIKENHAAWAYNLDFPVDDFEQLIFIINHGLDKLLGQIEHYGFSTEQLDIFFKLQNKTERDYQIKTSFPTLEKTFWLKLINLRISLDPPECEIVSVRIVSYFTRPRPAQKGLYSVSRPDPENLLLTVNKIKRLVGEGNVGVPVLLDQRLDEAFSLNADDLPKGKERVEIRSENSIIAFSYFHPPLPAEVLIRDKRLIFIRTQFFQGRVLEYSGVWKGSSKWWEKSWKTQEWDVQIEKLGVYRLRHAEKGWFLVGEYD